MFSFWVIFSCLVIFSCWLLHEVALSFPLYYCCVPTLNIGGGVWGFCSVLVWIFKYVDKITGITAQVTNLEVVEKVCNHSNVGK